MGLVLEALAFLSDPFPIGGSVNASGLAPVPSLRPPRSAAAGLAQRDARGRPVRWSFARCPTRQPSGPTAAPDRRLFARRAAADATGPGSMPRSPSCSICSQRAPRRGSPAPLSLRRAVDGLVGPLADELLTAVHAVDVGARWRDELGALEARVDLPDLRRTVSALTRTETLGSSLAQATAELADSVRRARRAAATERARTAPVKMLPAGLPRPPRFLLLTVVPVLLTTVQSIN